MTQNTEKALFILKICIVQYKQDSLLAPANNIDTPTDSYLF
jgi:hypothetical protein